jgi:hypothetical protein
VGFFRAAGLHAERSSQASSASETTTSAGDDQEIGYGHILRDHFGDHYHRCRFLFIVHWSYRGHLLFFESMRPSRTCAKHQHGMVSGSTDDSSWKYSLIQQMKYYDRTGMDIAAIKALLWPLRRLDL